MVLSSLHISTRAIGGVCRGPLNSQKIEALNILTHKNIFFKLCKACQLNTMASIPPSAFSAARIRETQRDMKVSKPSKGGGSEKIFNVNFMELAPLKYNSKLMNSIWGRYNRFSPHNIKKFNDANLHNGEMQQLAATPSTKSEAKITLLSVQLDNAWTAINVSQSH